MSPLRIMLVDADPQRQIARGQVFNCAQCEIVATVTAGNDLLEQIVRHQPDVIIIDMDSPSRDTLENLRNVQTAMPRPMVMFSQADDSDSIRRAVAAGVSAYVVDGIQPKRVRPILDAAIARFEQYRALADELAKTRSQLVERKLVDRAKGLIMKQRQVSEDEAYHLLRKTAMDRNKRLVDVAEAIISAADLLGAG